MSPAPVTAAGAAIGTNPQSAYGTTGLGQTVYIDEHGEVQQVPFILTPPFGEPGMYDAALDAPGDDDWNSGAPADPPFNWQQQQDAIHEWIHGTPWDGIDLGEWVNPQNPGIPNLGPVNEQPFQSAHTNAVPHNSSVEQGWGLDPAILYPRRPNVQNTNPYYALGTFRRMGGLAWQVPGIPFGSVTQQHVESRWGPFRRASTTHEKLVDVPANVPYSSTVPVHGQAGPVEILPPDAEGIYP
jgi:hypothetical protein